MSRDSWAARDFLVVPVPKLSVPEENISGRPSSYSCRTHPAGAVSGRTLSTETDMGFIHVVQVRKQDRGLPEAFSWLEVMRLQRREGPWKQEGIPSS